jgi:hypothetical protein
MIKDREDKRVKARNKIKGAKVQGLKGVKNVVSSEIRDRGKIWLP